LENAKELVEEFERIYGEEVEELRQLLPMNSECS